MQMSSFGHLLTAPVEIRRRYMSEFPCSELVARATTGPDELRGPASDLLHSKFPVIDVREHALMPGGALSTTGQTAAIQMVDSPTILFHPAAVSISEQNRCSLDLTPFETFIDVTGSGTAPYNIVYLGYCYSQDNTAEYLIDLPEHHLNRMSSGFVVTSEPLTPSSDAEDSSPRLTSCNHLIQNADHTPGQPPLYFLPGVPNVQMTSYILRSSVDLSETGCVDAITSVLMDPDTRHTRQMVQLILDGDVGNYDEGILNAIRLDVRARLVASIRTATASINADDIDIIHSRFSVGIFRKGDPAVDGQTEPDREALAMHKPANQYIRENPVA